MKVRVIVAFTVDDIEVNLAQMINLAIDEIKRDVPESSDHVVAVNNCWVVIEIGQSPKERT